MNELWKDKVDGRILELELRLCSLENRQMEENDLHLAPYFRSESTNKMTEEYLYERKQTPIGACVMDQNGEIYYSWTSDACGDQQQKEKTALAYANRCGHTAYRVMRGDIIK